MKYNRTIIKGDQEITQHHKSLEGSKTYECDMRNGKSFGIEERMWAITVVHIKTQALARPIPDVDGAGANSKSRYGAQLWKLSICTSFKTM